MKRMIALAVVLATQAAVAQYPVYHNNKPGEAPAAASKPAATGEYVSPEVAKVALKSCPPSTPLFKVVKDEELRNSIADALALQANALKTDRTVECDTNAIDNAIAFASGSRREKLEENMDPNSPAAFRVLYGYSTAIYEAIYYMSNRQRLVKVTFGPITPEMCGSLESGKIRVITKGDKTKVAICGGKKHVEPKPEAKPEAKPEEEAKKW
jgi:hypothetical protein